MNYGRMMNRRQPWHRKYRVMRDEQGHPGGGQGGGTFTPPVTTVTPNSGSNNGGGNSGGSGGDSQQNNNGGQQFDPNAFWTGSPGGNESAPPSGESTGGSSQSGGQQDGNQQQQQASPAQALMTELSSLNFGSGPMTDKAIKDLSEGNVESFHQGMQQYGQQIATQTVRLVAGLMGQLREEMRNEFQQNQSDTFRNRDNDAELLREIPSASNPAIKKIVDPIFARALEVTKGDRKAALGMTKDMLKFQIQGMEPDLGLPPRSAGDNDGALQPSNINWLEELSGR